MTTQYRKVDGPFAQVARDLAQDSTLGPCALACYAFVQSLPNNAPITVEFLHRRFAAHVGYRAIANAVNELIAAGVYHRLNVRTGRKRKNGTTNAVDTRVLVTPIPMTFAAVARILARMEGVTVDRITPAPAGSRKVREALAAGEKRATEYRLVDAIALEQLDAAGYPQDDETPAQAGVRDIADPGTDTESEHAAQAGVRGSGQSGTRVPRAPGYPEAQNVGTRESQARETNQGDACDESDPPQVDPVEKGERMITDPWDSDPRSTAAIASRLVDGIAHPNAAGWTVSEVDAALTDIANRIGVDQDAAAGVLTAIAKAHKPRRLIAYVKGIPAEHLAELVPAPTVKRPAAGTARPETKAAPDCEHGTPNGTGRTVAGEPLCVLCRNEQRDTA